MILIDDFFLANESKSDVLSMMIPKSEVIEVTLGHLLVSDTFV